MVSNFLGEVVQIERISSIISGNEIMAREGVNLQKGMNFRDGEALLSIFLVLPHEAVFKDTWDADTEIYTYLGHDSTTVESGKLEDQILMYESGKLTDNGKFRKAANGFKDGIRTEPMQVQVYEKLDAGIWFDKGIFNLVDSMQVTEEGRRVYQFHLNPIGTESNFDERMLSATVKAEAWVTAKGRCATCKGEEGLRFVAEASKKGSRIKSTVQLLCVKHSGAKKRGGMLG